MPPQKCTFQLHFQSLPTLLCLFSWTAKYSMCHKYLTWLEQDRDPCQLSPIGVRIRSLIQPAIMARHPTCGRDTPICAGIHYVPTDSNMERSYLSSHILTMRRHRFSNHLWQVLAGDSLGTFDPPWHLRCIEIERGTGVLNREFQRATSQSPLWHLCRAKFDLWVTYSPETKNSIL